MHVRVRVVPKARREKVTQVSDTELHIEVREPRTGNQANQRVLEILKRMYHTTQVRILTGHRSSTKMVEVGV